MKKSLKWHFWLLYHGCRLCPGEKRSRKNSKKGSKKKTNAEKKKSVPSARHVCQTSADETIFNACVKTPDEKIIEGSIKQLKHLLKYNLIVIPACLFDNSIKVFSLN